MTIFHTFTHVYGWKNFLMKLLTNHERFPIKDIGNDRKGQKAVHERLAGKALPHSSHA